MAQLTPVSVTDHFPPLDDFTRLCEAFLPRPAAREVPGDAAGDPESRPLQGQHVSSPASWWAALQFDICRGHQEVLRAEGKCGVYDPVPLVLVKDIMTYMPQMKYMFTNMMSSEPTSKRQRVA